MGLVLAIDIGKGTEDVLIWDRSKIDIANFENTIQIVAPSRTNQLQDPINELIKSEQDVYFKGEIMAGEPWHRLLYAYLEKHPGKVHITENAAMSLRYNLDQVRSKGLKIYTEDEFSKLDKTTQPIITHDIAWGRIVDVIKGSGYRSEDIEKVLICCQDHGNPEDTKRSSRDYRMTEIYSHLDETGKLADLLKTTTNVSENMPRHKAVGQSTLNQFEHLNPSDVMIMDSSPAVVLGVLDLDKDKQLVINVGNGHTIMIALNQGLVEFVYEFHTGGISSERIMSDLHRIFSGELTHEQSLEEGGHGLYIRSHSYNLEEYLPITLIGPNRKLLQNLDAELAHPIGNMMMAGPNGLIRAFLYNNG